MRLIGEHALVSAESEVYVFTGRAPALAQTWTLPADVRTVAVEPGGLALAGTIDGGAVYTVPINDRPSAALAIDISDRSALPLRFQVDTFEMVNIIIGGLFAVIALNFTVNSVYQVLESGDNPVNRLFALNYMTLAISLAVAILVYRFRVVERGFGRYAQEQFYLFLVWAIPLLVLTTAVAIILVALA